MAAKTLPPLDTNLPLIIDAPGYSSGRSRALAELIDIYPTVSELAGLKVPGEVQGQSLVPVLKNPAASVRRGALSLNRGNYGLRTTDWAYLRYKDGSAELYDMKADPHQFTNLAKHPQHAKTAALLDKFHLLSSARQQQPCTYRSARLCQKADVGKKHNATN